MQQRRKGSPALLMAIISLSRELWHSQQLLWLWLGLNFSNQISWVKFRAKLRRIIRIEIVLACFIVLLYIKYVHESRNRLVNQ